jgi:hypothetical protein
LATFAHSKKSTGVSKDTSIAGGWGLTPVIPTTQEAESRRTVVQSQPGQIVCGTLSQKNKKTNKKKNPSQKRPGGVKPK